MRKPAAIKFRFESSSSDRIYTTQVNDDGRLSCNCPGWCFKRSGKARGCWHVKAVAEKLNRRSLRVAA